MREESLPNVFYASCMSESAAEGLGQQKVSTAFYQSHKGFPCSHVCLLLTMHRWIKWRTSKNTDHSQYFWQERRGLKQQWSKSCRQNTRVWPESCGQICYIKTWPETYMENNKINCKGQVITKNVFHYSQTLFFLYGNVEGTPEPQVSHVFIRANNRKVSAGKQSSKI